MSAPVKEPPQEGPKAPAELSDTAFVAAVEAATYPGEAFRHREHVRLAWLCLREHGFESGLERVRGLIQRYATALGATGKYHETLTRAWAELVQVGLDAAPDVTSFDAFLSARPELSDSRLLERHYRKETLASPEAKAGWVPPDRAPLPSRQVQGAPGVRPVRTGGGSSQRAR